MLIAESIGFATLLEDEVGLFSKDTLNEEKAANSKLNIVALRKGVNRRAAS